MIEEAVAPLKVRIAELEAENERLKAKIAKLKKNSTTSSKPPSSDIVKPPRPPKSGGKRGKRRAGGQLGHARHTRPAFRRNKWTQLGTTSGRKCRRDGGRSTSFASSSKSNWPRSLTRSPSIAPGCMKTSAPARLWRLRCRRRCGARTARAAADGIGGLSERGLPHVGRDDPQISRRRVPSADQPRASDEGGAESQHGARFSHEELQNSLPRQAYMGIDETGHHERGRGLWSWCFHVPGEDRFTWFHIDPSRGSKVLKRYLGEAFGGIVGCDYFSAYRKFFARPTCGCNCVGRT